MDVKFLFSIASKRNRCRGNDVEGPVPYNFPLMQSKWCRVNDAE